MFDKIKDIISEPGSIQDKIGNLAEEFTGGNNLQDQLGQAGGLDGIREQLNGISFPIERDSLVTTLEERGVPNGVTDRLHNLDLAQFQSPEDVIGRIRGFFG